VVKSGRRACKDIGVPDLRRSLPALALSTLLAAAPAAAQEAGEKLATGTKFGNWTVGCEALGEGETTCYLQQSLHRSSDNAFVATFIALWGGPQRDQGLMIARVPVGVYFPAGLGMKPMGSDSQFNFTWQLCNPQLCEALVTLTEADFRQLEAADEVRAGFKPARGADDAIFNVPMTGLNEGLAALKAARQAGQ